MFRYHNLQFLLIMLTFAPFSTWAKGEPSISGPTEELFVNANYPRGLKEADLRDLSLADPKLRLAYFFLIQTANSDGPVTDEHSPEMLEVLKDVKRRGDSATPLWLDIMAKNPNTTLECYIPWILRRIGGIKMGPYADYYRKMIQTRPDEINATAAVEALSIFRKYGTEADVDMVRELAKRGPMLASAINGAFENIAYWKAYFAEHPEEVPTPEPVEAKTPKTPEKDPEKTASPASAPAMPRERAASYPTRIAAAVALTLAALGLRRWLVKRRQ